MAEIYARRCTGKEEQEVDVLVPVIDVTRDPGCEERKKYLEKINTNS